MMWGGAAIGFISGIISGMGIGGGTILIPALLFLTEVNQQQAQGVNLIYFIPTAVVALITHHKNGTLDLKTAKPLALLGLAGAAAGAFLAVSLESEILKFSRRKKERIHMQRDDFMKLKLKFAQTDVAGKIAIYTETPGLSAAQYKELLRMYPIEKLEELEAVLAKL